VRYTRLGAKPERRLQAELAEVFDMLWTIALVLFVLWLLGTVSAYTMGGLIHGLLVLALILVVVNLFTGRRTVV